MEECHTPAISIAIIENFEICEIYTYGVRRRGTKKKVTTDDGSGIVVMQNSDIGARIRDEVTNAFKEICGW